MRINYSILQDKLADGRRRTLDYRQPVTSSAPFSVPASSETGDTPERAPHHENQNYLNITTRNPIRPPKQSMRGIAQ